MDSQNQQSDHQYETGTETATGPLIGFDERKAREGARLLLEAVGRNPEEADIYETWNRRVPAMLETLTEGMRPREKPVMRTFDTETDGLVVKMGIPLHSMCEHHMLPFHGVVHVAYSPGKSMVGLSKLIRYVRWQSRRLTTQEELTRDIAAGLADELDAECVLVELAATHTCETMRGVETATRTTTRETVGAVSDTDREQFRESIQRDGASGISY